MDDNEMIYAKGVLIRLAQAARDDEILAARIRALVAQTGFYDIFGAGPATDPLAILKAGGAPMLRARLATLSVADLKQVIADGGFDPEKTAARWRSTTKLAGLIVSGAVARWEEIDRERAEREQEVLAPVVTVQPPKSLPGTEWML